MNYFELYEIPESFSIDRAALKTKFYELSKRYHPDFYVNESPEKQQEILALSTLNNKAYQVLTDPAKRTAYILSNHNLLEEGEKYQLSQDFLMNMMEINEALMEAEFDTDAEKIQQLNSDIKQIESALGNELKQYTEAFDAKASANPEDLLLKIKDVWFRQKYLLRIRDSLNRFAAR
ncbi:Fe-S protein assembly co-chaperone HscB [Pedobacter sp. BS3]|uniref:Fe-S protein assembly co-chaperone HscB n=1 Tax=Pedobacter sp. BS3 TaxID=2567937 RepID=UPI0011EE7954|nr:Fe-S protein assembly co-chaperone HscB [Pedobacter sp. BS3]TZF84953.1 Fe-S protein assembly co-chaperone HscB [Pedobacter sp. BS3]